MFLIFSFYIETKKTRKQPAAQPRTLSSTKKTQNISSRQVREANEAATSSRIVANKVAAEHRHQQRLQRRQSDDDDDDQEQTKLDETSVILLRLTEATLTLILSLVLKLIDRTKRIFLLPLVAFRYFFSLTRSSPPIIFSLAVFLVFATSAIYLTSGREVPEYLVDLVDFLSRLFLYYFSHDCLIVRFFQLDDLSRHLVSSKG